MIKNICVDLRIIDAEETVLFYVLNHVVVDKVFDGLAASH